MPFTPASLQKCDVVSGDANVICFGSSYGLIDSNARGDIELVLDLNKLSLKSGHAFFKQQDFGFCLEKTRQVNIGKEKNLEFRHTSRGKSSNFASMHLSYHNKEVCKSASSFLPEYKLISYDINNIESVLILNFFRHLDGLCDQTIDENIDGQYIISEIYQDIEKMNDEELTLFLESIGRNLSDTMEFNFFGAFQIDFDALAFLKDEESGFSLNMVEFISGLQNGKLQQLIAAKEKFSTVFQSYRFLDYLSTKTDNPKALAGLSALRSICKIPDWYPKNGKLETPIAPLVVKEAEQGAKDENPVDFGPIASITSPVFTPQRNQQRRKRQTEVTVPLRWSKRIAAKQKDSSKSFVAKRGCYRVV